MSLPTPAEVAATDWISAIAAILACLASFILATIAWKQARISEKQTMILNDHAEIFSRQAYYQGQQTTISKKQAELSSQQLAIIKDQEADRKNAAMRADLIVSSRAESTNVIDLILENRGSGWAREIKIYIEGYQLEESHPEEFRLLPGSKAQKEIGPGNKIDYLLEFPGSNPPTNLRVDIKWISDNGIVSTTVAYIIPRQQLSVYSQEHKKPEIVSIAQNNPRIEAYAKFMEAISMRPINGSHAQYKILPQLETIQLYSSPEVKKISKEINDWARIEMKATGKMPHLPDFTDRINNELKPIIAKEIEDLQINDGPKKALLTPHLLKREDGAVLEIHNGGNKAARNISIISFGKRGDGTHSSLTKPIYNEASIPANESIFIPAEFPGWEEIYVTIEWDDDLSKGSKITVPIQLKSIG